MAEAEKLEKLVRRVRNLPPEAAAREARAFFDRLQPGTGIALADGRPELVGSLDGAPAALRYRANHLRLLAARDRLHAAIDAGTATDHERRRLQTVNELLTPVTGTDVDASGNVVKVQRPRQFLVVEPEGQGRAVEVLGDLDRARHIAILVPGMGNNLETIRDQVDRADLIRREAGPGSASVLWLDYDSPQVVRDAMSSVPAQDAGLGLRQFTAGLDAETLPTAKVTLIGHSYGSHVVGQGLINGVRVDRVVLTGSPGVAKSVNGAAELVPPQTRLFVERAPGDYVSYTEWHGPDPATYPDATRMATNEPAGGRITVQGHNEYYRPNSEALRNVGRVVRGDLAHVTTTDTSRSAETKLAPGLSWGEPLHSAVGAAAKVFDGIAALRKATPDRAAASTPVPQQGVLEQGTRPATHPARTAAAHPRRPEGPKR